MEKRMSGSVAKGTALVTGASAGIGAVHADRLANRGYDRIQAVLPGATATDFWPHAGLPYQNLPAEIEMSVEDMVDAEMIGLDRGELVTSPPLQDDEWTRFEASRRALAQRFGNSVLAPRYRTRIPAQQPA
jgi:hypothetical protein